MGDQELESRARERLGTTLNGKYRLDALIGVGGMAVVYRATHRNRAQLALKMLHPELSQNANVRARFLREGYAANSVNHPGAVLVTDDDVAEDGSAFLVMELLDGAGVDELWARFSHKMPAALAIDITLQLLEVLEAAHAAGVVHRDIKPANLFLTRDGVVKVLDFGIARALDPSSGAASATGTGMPIGTPTFMAPEQALARSADIGPRTDVWAAGATLFTLLSGENVHEAPTAAETLVHAATKPARLLSQVAPEVPTAVAQVVNRALAFEIAERWPSARAMSDALAAAWGASADGPRSRSALASLFPPRSSSALPAPASSPQVAELGSAPTVSATGPSTGASPGETTLPLSSTRVPVPHRPGRSRRAIVIASVLVASAAATGLWLRSRGGRGTATSSVSMAASSTPPSASAGPTLVIIPGSQNLTNDPLFDGAIEAVLDSSLKRSMSVYPFTGPAMRDLVNELAPGVAGQDEEIGRIIAAKRRIRVVMARPAVAQAGAGYRISLVAKDGATGAPLADLAESATGLDGVVPAVARLGCALRVALGDAPCDAASLERVGLSASIEADHDYMVGRNALSSGRYEEAVSVYQKAIRIDPSFSMAHNGLGIVLLNLSRNEEGQERMKFAMAHREGLSEREGLELSATYHLLMDEFDQARDAYEQILTRWPADTHFRGNLAATYMQTGQLERALESGRRAAEEHPALMHARSNVPTFLMITGRLEDASEATRAVLAVFPHALAATYSCGALTSLLLGRRDEALGMLAMMKSVDASAAAFSQADFAMFEGRLKDAVSILKDGLAADERDKATAYAETKWVALAEAMLRQGDLAKAREAVAHASKSDDLVTLLAAARVLARTGKDGEAATLGRIIGAHPGLRAPLFARIVAADVLLAKHATKQAVASAMGEPGAGPGAWVARADLGAAYLELGAFEDAERELSAAVASQGAGAVAFFDDEPTLRYAPVVHYQLARAKDALHRPDAAEAYKTFLAMESGAQADPLVADAKKRLGAR